LKLEFRSSWPYVGPVWAVLSGALAAGGWALKGENWLAIALIVFLAEVVMGAWWENLSHIARLDEEKDVTPVEMVPPPPYTRPGSLARSVWAKLNHFLSWWVSCFWPQAGPSFLTLLALGLLALLLACCVGRAIPLLLLAAGALSGLGALALRRGREPYLLEALFTVTIPWLMGHVLFALLNLASLYLALCFAVIYGALRGRGRLRGDSFLFNTAHAALVVLLWWLREPVVVGVVSALWVGQLLFHPVAGSVPEAGWLWRRSQPFVVALMLVSAWAIM